MNRLTALAAIALLWAAIYLPGLGFPELKGEEPRRALPAIAMLDTGDWLVPQITGERYLSKPPLVNWLIALSMKATGERDEWAARLPSVLAMLALGVALVWTGSRWLSPAGGFTAAAFVLASAAFVEKGRLAEIEADYVALTGIAFAWWLAAWAKRDTGWRLWLVPGIFLGLGLLAKGPTHILLFYAVVIPVLVAAREYRQLWSPAHLGAVALALLIFAAWLIPYDRVTAGHAHHVWMAQMEGRVGGGSLHLKDWLPNLPRALFNGLPWLVFAPLWWNRRVLAALGEKEERLRLLIIAARWPLAIAYAGLMLIPGMLPRYTLPLFPAIALLLALVAPYAPPRSRTVWWWVNAVLLVVVVAAGVACGWIAKPAAVLWNPWALLPLGALLFAMSRRLEKPGRQKQLPENPEEPSAPDSRESTATLVSWTAWIVAGGMAVYSIAVLPRIHAVKGDLLRPIGSAVNAMVPSGASLFVVGKEYEPSLFYVHRPCVFVDSLDALPAQASYILLRRDQWMNSGSRLPRISEVSHVQIRNGREFFVLKRAPETETTPAPQNNGG